MKDITPAKVSICCFIFLVVLYFTGSLDFSLTALIIILIFIFRIAVIYLFLSAIISFIVYLTFNFFNLHIDFIKDPAVSSYILFACGLIQYFLQRQNNHFEFKSPSLKHIILNKSQLLKLCTIALIILTIYPLVGLHLSIIVGYIAFIYIFKRLADGRYAFGTAFISLILCPFLLILKKEKIAETSAILAYYFLAIGTLQEIIAIIRSPEIIEENGQKINFHNHREKIALRQVLRKDYRMEKLDTIYHNISLISKPIIFGSAVFILILTGIIFLPQIIPIQEISDKINGEKMINPLKPTSGAISAVISPSSIPTLTIEKLKEVVIIDLSSMQISVENGTTISGLAASTASRLKTEGINNVAVGNALKRDYKKWEIIFKNKKEKLVQYLVKLFQLTSAEIKEATTGSKFDITIIVGEKR